MEDNGWESDEGQTTRIKNQIAVSEVMPEWSDTCCKCPFESGIQFQMGFNSLNQREFDWLCCLQSNSPGLASFNLWQSGQRCQTPGTGPWHHGEVGCQHERVSWVFWDVVHHARQFYLKVHRTSVTYGVMRGGRANARPGGRGNCIY